MLFEGVLGCRIKISGEGQTTADLGLFKWVFGCRIKVLSEEKTRADLGLFEWVLGEGKTRADVI
jgi:hypothetical protein